MDAVSKAFIGATKSLVHPIILMILLVPLLFRFDPLSDHADAVEMKHIFEFARGRLFLLGLLTGVLYFIPPINLIAPIFSALAQRLGEMQGLGARK